MDLCVVERNSRTYLRWTVPLNNTQMGLGALGELQMRSRESNNRSHTTVASCPLYHPPNEAPGLAALDDDTVYWFKRTTLSI